VRLGPSVPDTPSASVAASSAPPVVPATPVAVAPSTAAAAVAAVPAPPAIATASPAPAAASSVSLSVGRGAIFACKTSDGDALKGAECGTLPGLDSLVMPRLRKLAQCPDAAAATGKLRLVVHVDFARSSMNVDLGRGNALPSSEALVACAKDALAGAGGTLAGIAHDKARYSVAYSVILGASGPAASGEAPPTAAAPSHPAEENRADGSAQIVWDVALLRDAPRSGKVVARLQRGTTVRLGPMKEAYYPIKFGDGFASDGWVYRAAVGK
jgi:hypothetical protein